MNCVITMGALSPTRRIKGSENNLVFTNPVKDQQISGGCSAVGVLTDGMRNE